MKHDPFKVDRIVNQHRDHVALFMAGMAIVTLHCRTICSLYDDCVLQHSVSLLFRLPSVFLLMSINRNSVFLSTSSPMQSTHIPRAIPHMYPKLFLLYCMLHSYRTSTYCNSTHTIQPVQAKTQNANIVYINNRSSLG